MAVKFGVRNKIICSKITKSCQEKAVCLINFKNNLNHSVVPNPPPVSVEGKGRVEPPIKISKREDLTGSQFLEGGCWEIGGDRFQGVVFLHKK